MKTKVLLFGLCLFILIGCSKNENKDIVFVSFTVNKTRILIGESVTFTNTSLGYNTSTQWKWIFEGGTPYSSTQKDPSLILYNLSGVFTVKLFANNKDSAVFKFIIVYDTLLDRRDYNTYKTIQIGYQTWMAENLNFKPNFGSWSYNNDPNQSIKYGRLYNWSTSLLYCSPNGWHIPSDEEWTQLIDFLGGPSIAGNCLKEVGTDFWLFPNDGATNSSGFTALPSGYFDGSSFNYLNQNAMYWSSTEFDANNSYARILSFDGPEMAKSVFNKDYGFALRCIKN